MSDTLNLVLAERERRRRQDLLVEAPKWDWYGPDCGCPHGGRKQDGSCPLHKRARHNQRPPDGDDWITWYVEAGRGFGKTEAGAQWTQFQAETLPPKSQIGIVAPTAADLRIVMVEGPSGILSVAKPWFYPEYQPSKSRLVWPNGTIGLLLSADEPKRFRGPQYHKGWLDELAAWFYPEAFAQFMYGLRLGDNPQVCITTTPKPLQWLREIKKQEGTVVVKGTTYDNLAHLAKSFINTIIKPAEGTRQGRQELLAEDLEDTPGALWNSALLDDLRIDASQLPDRVRVAIGVDPSNADPNKVDESKVDECGITAGMMAYVEHPTMGAIPHGYLLADRSLKAHPNDWAKAAINAYHEFGADLIVAEKNNGGEMVAGTIHAIDANIPVHLVFASRAKITRAEPIATFYEQRRIWHLRGPDFSTLESQMCTYVPGLRNAQSPDRMDSLVWLFTELLTNGVPLSFGAHPFEEWR